MGLRTEAEVFLAQSVEDADTGFGWPVTVIDPDGISAELVGLASDIAFQIDPDTGQMVSGTLVTVALRISSLTCAGLGLPIAIEDETEKPWLVEFNDINGNFGILKVKKSYPDRAIGLITLDLEAWQCSSN